MTPSRTKRVKAWALIAAGLNSLQLVRLTRGEVSLEQADRAEIYKTYVVPCTITYTLPTITKSKKKK